jgi:polysaccharide export outer membrane protein
MLVGAVAWAQQQPPSTYAQPKTSTTGSTASPSSATPDVPSSPANLPKAADADSAQSSEPAVGIGDLLRISVMGAPDYDQELRVGGSGDVNLALVGPVHVAGLSPDQAAGVIRERLMQGGFFSDPQVSVFQKEFATQGVSVLGEVQKPGVYPIVGPRHLFDVLSLAGGTTPKAGQLVSITHRKEPGKSQTVTLSNDLQKNLSANISIFPGDTVVVSKAGIVYVVGDVRTPTGVILDNGGNLTVLQAIAMAQGANGSAALNKSRIIRKTPEGQKEIPIALKKILAAKSPDVKLQAEDIVFVPSSAAKSAALRGMNAAVQLATSVVAYRAIY